MGARKENRRITGNEIAFVALAALGTLFMTACLALSAFARLSADGNVYYKIQMAHEVDAGISGEEMFSLDMMLADYLAGDETALEKSVFNEKEKAHMVDVFDIFECVRLVRNICFLAGCAFLAWAVFLPARGKKRRALAVFMGGFLFFAPIIAIVIWAAVDFSTAFTAMHHLLFTNDLWLLDPRTDLMIRMLPQRFFESMAAYLAIGTGISALCAPVLCGIVLTGAGKFLKK